MSVDDLPGTYTNSPEYLKHLISFHADGTKQEALSWLREHIHRDESLIDVGCAAGFTGLAFALLGYSRVTLHDFEGLGLGFARWFVERYALPVSVVPYGMSVDRHDWAVALDVIEHTGNHLGFLRWMDELGRTVAITHPTVEFTPPYAPVLDQWVDGEALVWCIERRYRILEHGFKHNRRFIVFTRE